MCRSRRRPMVRSSVKMYIFWLVLPPLPYPILTLGRRRRFGAREAAAPRSGTRTLEDFRLPVARHGSALMSSRLETIDFFFAQVLVIRKLSDRVLLGRRLLVVDVRKRWRRQSDRGRREAKDETAGGHAFAQGSEKTSWRTSADICKGPGRFAQTSSVSHLHL